MKPSFNIEDPSLKQDAFSKKVGQNEELRARILEQTTSAGNDNTTSNQVVWAAVAGVAVFVTLFGILSQIDYSISLYDTTLIAEQDAEDFYNQEIDELSLTELSYEIEPTHEINITTGNLSDDEIANYLTYADVTTYDLSNAYNEN